MQQDTVTIEAVDRELARRSNGLRFPPALEAAYEERTRSYRSRVLVSGTWPTAITYNLFLPIDLFLLPDTAQVAVVLHALVTPWILLTGLVFRREPGLVLREALAVSIPLLMAAQVIAVFGLNDGRSDNHYQYLAILIAMFMNINMRPDFRFALAGSAGIGSLYWATILTGASPLPVKLIGSASMAVVIYFTAMANRRMERDDRYGFLRRLGDQLRREEAEAAAGRDTLTGLANRRELDIRTEQLWKRRDDEVSPVAIVMLDVDHFKAFNDRYGHPAGDLCLKRVANAVSAELRSRADLAVRFGGEEFLVLLPGTDLGSALQLAERVRRAVEGLAIPHGGIGGRGLVTVSLGVMAGLASAHPAAEMIAAADTALYAAKRAGRNQVWPPFMAADEAGGRVEDFSRRRPEVARP